MDSDYLDQGLKDFSGYIVVDELYDGPFCVLLLVDGQKGRRLLYEVLDHDPDQGDIQRFLARFQELLRARGLRVRGVTTDGSALYSEPIQQVFGAEVSHQVCRFHVLADITLAVLHALAQVRKRLRTQLPKLGRGRPSRQQARLIGRKQRAERHLGQLFEHRYLFVQHGLGAAERNTLKRLSRSHPELRHLREIMDEVYRLFDRRCRTDTALAKLAHLRQRVRRFRRLQSALGPLFSPNLEKALLFLDDRQLTGTSNAVERANRRYRKMQQAVYRVRTQEHIAQRLALDLAREAHGPGRRATEHTLCAQAQSR